MDKLDELYYKIADRVTPLFEEATPMEIAAILVAQGLGLYKTFLDDDDYDRMVEAIYNLRYEINKITEGRIIN